MAAATLVVAAAATGAAQQRTQVLPVSAYLDALPDVSLGWTDPATGNSIFTDAFGKRAAVFGLHPGTVIDGQVTVKPLGSGKQKVTVLLHTTNAICWGFNSDLAPAFGYRPLDVADGLGRASLGDVMTRFEFTQPVGPIDTGASWDVVQTTVNCQGQLRAGSTYPEGTPGFAHTTQVGLYITGVPSGCPPEKDADCFPSERIQFKPR
jgi:hypothetical protein